MLITILVECAALGAASAAQLENSLLILIQKLLATLSSPNFAGANNNATFQDLFFGRSDQFDFGSHAAHSASAGVSGRGLGTTGINIGSLRSSVSSAGRLQRRIPASVPLRQYSAPTLGVILAGQMLLRARPAISSQDRQAILNFLVRSQPIMQDVAVLYALDVLAVSLQCAMLCTANTSSSFLANTVINSNKNNNSSGSSSGCSSDTRSSLSCPDTTGHNESASTDEAIQQLHSALQSLFSNVIATFKLSNRYVSK